MEEKKVIYKKTPHIIFRVSPEEREEIHRIANEDKFESASHYLRTLHRQYLKNRSTDRK